MYPMLRLILNNASVNLPIDLSSVKSILFLRHDRIGDYIVTTPVLKALRRRYPQLRIGMIASERNIGIIRDQKLVDAVHLIPNSIAGILKGIAEARACHYDVIINLVFNRTTTGGLLANLIGPQSMKIGQGAEKYRFYFNALVSVDHENEHMADAILSLIAQSFGVRLDAHEKFYSLEVSTDAEARVRDSVTRYTPPSPTSGSGKSTFAVLNVSAADSHRNLSWNQIHCIVTALQDTYEGSIVMISSPAERQILQRIQEHVRSAKVFIFPEAGSSSIAEVSALINHAHFVISPDTAIIHIACAHSVPIFGLYLESTNRRWHPRGVPSRVIYSETRSIADISTEQCRIQLAEFIRSLTTRAR